MEPFSTLSPLSSLSSLSSPPVVPATAVAVVGAGRWGRHLLRNFRSLPQAEVVALVDWDTTALQTLAQRCDLPPTVALLSDWQQLWQLPRLDAVVVATPAAAHEALIRSALMHHCHVLAEKPLTLSSATAQALCQLAQQQQRQLVVDHTYLFHPAVQSGQTALVRQELGSLRHGYGSRTHLGPVRQDVDALWDLAIHDLCIFNHWLGYLPLKVQAEGLSWLPHPGASVPSSPSLSSQSLSSENLMDQVWATLIYPPNLPVRLQWGWANADKQRRLVLVGDRGSLVLDELAPQPLVLYQGHLEFQGGGWQVYGGAGHGLPVAHREPLQEVCQHFLDCVREQRRSTLSDGWVGVTLLRVLEALSRSLQEGGKWVTVADCSPHPLSPNPSSPNPSSPNPSSPNSSSPWSPSPWP
ncbi:Gfo/Idh/MocA family protein [Prochlorothrix hollandica]|uniref:Gfo/Idh/MocA family protein n=1 Tax=Prochlorothrix hollandica TaxID=1223 RepID=UPI000348C226|nr:Gfo/Idh/MocA family oxidoreductase [Prochlorothrix hollandica]